MTEARRAEQEVGRSSPADACPYPRPFPEGFDDCPTYQETLFVGLDLQYRPLRPNRTCRFLTVGEASGTRGSFYGRCALGDAAARQRWIEHVDRERLEKLQALRTELGSLLRPQIEELWRLKGEQLRAQKRGEASEVAASTDALQLFSEPLNRQIESFFERHSTTLAELQLPRDPLEELARRALDAFVEQTTAEQEEFELPADVTDRLPPEIRTLLKPPVR